VTVAELVPSHPLVAPTHDTMAIIYLRLSDLRDEDMNEDGTGKTFRDRERKLRELAARLNWGIYKVIVENDCNKSRTGRSRPASAFKRKKVILSDGTTVMRVWRPGFRETLDHFVAGRANALLAEDLDRVTRDPRDLDDFIDIAEHHKINARSLTGSLTFTDGGTDAEITMARLMVVIANKSSRDTAKRVAAGRERKAANGEWGGGPRPFGFEADGITVRPAEAAVIAQCSERVLQLDQRTHKLTSLRQLARELREGDVPTVNGQPWTAPALRHLLLRPRNAGIAVFRDEETGPAPWEPIIPEDMFRAIVGLLTDPARRSGPGAAAKWLGSGLYRCGVCDDGTTCTVSAGRNHQPRYRCPRSWHLTRNVTLLDALMVKTVIQRLSQPDAVDLIPTVEPGVDVAKLRADAARIRQTLDTMAEDYVSGGIDRGQLLRATATANTRLAEIDEVLAAQVGTSPLAALIGVEDVAAEWELRTLSEKRAILHALYEVTILPTGPRGSVFLPEFIRIVEKSTLPPRNADNAA